MNFQTARVQTFYLIRKLTPMEKYSLATKGFYYEVRRNKFICYKCEASYTFDSDNIMNHIDLHQCGNQIKNNAEDVPIPSPYVQSGAVNVHNDLNYEEFRYATLANWVMEPTIKMSKLELASMGFYYAIRPNTLKCFYCKVIVDKMVMPSRAINQHKTNKKCLQKKFSFQIRVNNLSQDYFLPSGGKRKSPSTTNAEPIAGPSATCISCSPPLLSPSSQQIQKAVEVFVSDPVKKSFYTVTLNLGFDKHLVHKAIMHRLQLGDTFETKEDLVESCLTFEKNQKPQNTVETTKKIAEESEREMECKICMDKKISVVFKPCHHVVACLECGNKVNICPMCCSRIGECSKIYF